MPISAMLKFSADIIILVDNELRVIDANENALTSLGLSHEDLVGRLISDINSPLVTRLAIPDVFDEIQRTGEQMREFSVARLDEDRHYRVRLIPTVFDNRDEGVTVIGEDITDQIQFEERLMISEARFRAIVQDQTDFICRWRPDGTVTFINDALSRIVGISCNDAPGVNCLSYVHPEDLPCKREDLTHVPGTADIFVGYAGTEPVSGSQ
jgi:PAS domain S-box-containing protein